MVPSSRATYGSGQHPGAQQSTHQKGPPKTTLIGPSAGEELRRALTGVPAGVKKLNEL